MSSRRTGRRNRKPGRYQFQRFWKATVYLICLIFGHKKSRLVAYASGDKWPLCGRCGARLPKRTPSRRHSRAKLQPEVAAAGRDDVEVQSEATNAQVVDGSPHAGENV